MEIKEIMKQARDYFKSKLLSGEFEVKKISQHTADVVIDGEYFFCIWMVNAPHNRRIYEHGSNTMVFEMNKKEAIKLHGKINPVYKKWQNEVLLKEKQKKYEKLKAELGIAD